MLSAKRLYGRLLGWDDLEYAQFVVREQGPDIRYDLYERFDSNPPQQVDNDGNEYAVNSYLGWGVAEYGDK